MELSSESANSQVWDKEKIKHLLNTNDQAVVRAVQVLHGRQTYIEQCHKQTHDRNGRGFNSRDASFLSDIAIKLPRYQNRMTEKQLATCRRMISKYWKQLLEEVEQKGGVVKYR